MSDVICTIKNNIAELTLHNEAKLNALDSNMLNRLDVLLGDLERNEDIRSVVLTGSGQKAFCCGADISEWGKLSPAEFSRYWVRNGHRVFDRLARLQKPTIGAINGHAFGGGLELAACCDIRIMASNATLALPEAKVGIVPGWSGTQRLLRLLPESVIKEMALFGWRISAERAVGFGFISMVSDDPLEHAFEIASSLADISPRANELAKAMIHAAVGEDKAFAIEMLGSAAAASTSDRQEGVTAFVEKRSPEFKGR